MSMRMRWVIGVLAFLFLGGAAFYGWQLRQPAPRPLPATEQPAAPGLQARGGDGTPGHGRTAAHPAPHRAGRGGHHGPGTHRTAAGPVAAAGGGRQLRRQCAGGTAGPARTCSRSWRWTASCATWWPRWTTCRASRWRRASGRCRPRRGAWSSRTAMTAHTCLPAMPRATSRSCTSWSRWIRAAWWPCTCACTRCSSRPTRTWATPRATSTTASSR